MPELDRASGEPETRVFALADVLSITTDRLVSRRRMDGVVDIIGWITGADPLVGPRSGLRLLAARHAARVCLLREHPWLADVRPPDDLDNPDLYSWLVSVEESHGETLILSRPTRLADPYAVMDRALRDATQAALDLGRMLGTPVEEPPDAGSDRDTPGDI